MSSSRKGNRLARPQRELVLALVDPYVESVARVRALERVLLRRSDLEQALSRGSEEGVLSDTRFFPSGWRGGREATLSAARREGLALLNALTYDSPLVAIFRHRRDVDRLRAALKASLTGREFSPPPQDGQGCLSDEDIVELVKSRLPEGAPEAFISIVDRARGLWEEEQDLGALDRLLDEELLALQKATARTGRCPFLVRYFSLVIDLTNVRALHRSRVSGAGPERAEAIFLPGGSISIEELARAQEGDPGALKGLLAGTLLEALAEPSAELWAVEVEAERVRLGYLRSTKEALEGIEPLFAFYLARDKDITTLATVSAGLASGAPMEDMRCRAGPLWWEC